MDNERVDVPQLMDIYAHKKDFFLSRRVDDISATHYLGTAHNDFCSDSLSVSISVHHAQVMVHHFGAYCALAHASAELFCSSFYHADIQEFMDMIALLNDIVENNTIKYDMIKYKELIALFSYPMSLTRKICVLLPVRASAQALQKIRR